MDARGQMMLSPGDVLGGYEIEGYIARGGMAVVYRARDLSLGRRLALKLIAPELAGNDKFRQRFIRESELAASIDHPNVLPIYAAGEAEGTLYIAMRYVDGQDLGHVIAESGRLDPAEALPIFTQVAAALDTAHRHGLIHRDVKPGNILLTRVPGSLGLASGGDGENHVYLTDFGLTKRSTSLSGFTTAGHFIGTIAYVAPEQIAGREVTRAADVYAMGCVLYEALSGVAPFQRDDDAAMLWAHMSSMPEPLSGFVPGIPPGVDEVIVRAMAKNPAERTPSCRAVIAELREAFRTGYAPPHLPDDGTGPFSVGPRRPPAGSLDDEPSPIGSPEALGDSGDDGRYDTEDSGDIRSADRHAVDQPGLNDPLLTPPSAGAMLTPGPAGPPGAGAGAPPRSPRASGTRGFRLMPWVVAGLAVVVLLAGAFVVLPRWLEPEFVSYRGDEASASWLAFDRPADWSPHANLSKTCFCTNQYGGVLETGDWRNVISAIDNGTSVEGLYAEQTTRLNLDDATSVSEHLRTFLAENKKELGDPVRTTVDNRSAWSVEGTLIASKNPDLRLSIRYLMVMSASGRDTDHIVLFTSEQDKDKLSGRLDRVERSLRFLENG